MLTVFNYLMLRNSNKSTCFLFLINCFTNGSSQPELSTRSIHALSLWHIKSACCLLKGAVLLVACCCPIQNPRAWERVSKWEGESPGQRSWSRLVWSYLILLKTNQLGGVGWFPPNAQSFRNDKSWKSLLACAARCSACILMLEKSRSKLKEQKQTWKLMEGPSND